MKAVLIIFNFLFYPISIFSQVIVVNDKMNIVYFGVDNPIQFSANECDKNKLILIANCGQLRRNGHQYIWKLCGIKYETVIFTCYLKQTNKRKFLGEVEYRIKSAPTPKIIFGSTPEERERRHFGYRSVKLSIIEKGPSLDIENFDFDIRFIIKEYIIEICRKKGDTLRFKNIGQTINTNVMTEIEKLTEGDKIFIKNLIAYNVCEIVERKLFESSCLIL